MTACPPSFTWTCSTRTNCCPPLRRRRARTIQDVQRGHVWQGDCAAISIISLASYGYFLCASVISIEDPFLPRYALRLPRPLTRGRTAIVLSRVLGALSLSAR